MRVANLHGSPPSGSRANPRRGMRRGGGVCRGAIFSHDSVQPGENSATEQ
jgi:hypothetical protein